MRLTSKRIFSGYMRSFNALDSLLGAVEWTIWFSFGKKKSVAKIVGSYYLHLVVCVCVYDVWCVCGEMERVGRREGSENSYESRIISGDVSSMVIVHFCENGIYKIFTAKKSVFHEQFMLYLSVYNYEISSN